jgi:hypothetical protein
VNVNNLVVQKAHHGESEEKVIRIFRASRKTEAFEGKGKESNSRLLKDDLDG